MKLMKNPLDLSKKHVIVTGGSSGIGLAASMEASKLGAKICIIGRNEEKLKDALLNLDDNSGSYYRCADLSSIDSIANVIKEIVDNNGKVDGLVHCAGYTDSRALKITNPTVMRKMLEVHLLAFTELVRVLSGRRYSNDEASFIGVSSAAGIEGNKAQVAYSAAKGAMNSVVHPMAKELATRKIRVNTVAYGMVDTQMYRDGYLGIGCSNDELLASQYLGVIPPEYAGYAICFLLSDMSKYMTGTTLVYDAGALS